jgi:hypothetical protein
MGIKENFMCIMYAEDTSENGYWNREKNKRLDNFSTKTNSTF